MPPRSRATGAMAMPPKRGQSKGDTLAALRARVRELEQEVARRRREADLIAAASSRDDRRTLAELAALYELSRAVTGQLDTAQLVEAVDREVSRVLDVRNLAIFLYDPERRE